MSGTSLAETIELREDALVLAEMVRLWGVRLNSEDAIRNLSGLLRCKYPEITRQRSKRAIEAVIGNLNEDAPLVNR
jgi:hypothetical protein